MTWTKELKQPKNSPPFFILKKKFGRGRGYDSTNVQAIVALDGFEHRQGYRRFTVEPKNPDRPWESGTLTKGVNVQLSMNGTAQLTFEDFYELDQVIQEARSVLRALEA